MDQVANLIQQRSLRRFNPRKVLAMTKYKNNKLVTLNSFQGLSFLIIGTDAEPNSGSVLFQTA